MSSYRSRASLPSPYLHVLVLILCCVTARADNWPAWRGPGGQGHCAETNLPLKWSTTENVKWKVAMPAPGNSTPVIWGEKIFITQSNKEYTKRGLMCLDRAAGKLLWHQEIDYPAKETGVAPPYYPCAASPATDGERVVVSYGSAGMYCYDFAGKMLWKRDDLGKWSHTYGNASSPVLYGELAILWCGPDAKHTRLLAVNKKSGTTVWEHKEHNGSWSTPLIVPVNGNDQLLLSMPDGFKGFDPKTGEELWHCDGLTKLVYNSPLYGPDPTGKGGIAVAMSGYGGAALAVQLGGSGDITKDRLWHHPRTTQRVGSGAIVGEHVYILEANTAPHCYELRTGKQVWKVDKRLGDVSWSSMVVSGDRLYVLCQNGDTHVFAASPTYQLLASNRLGEYTNASIAVSNGELFIRTWENLWCIGKKK
jgi:outer membrane protein assembly factor BamB